MSTHRLATTMIYFGMSDPGRQRAKNEDHFIVADLTRKVIGVQENRVGPELMYHEIGACGTLLAVADGLGGHEDGEIASQLAVDTIVQALFATAEQDLPLAQQLLRAVDIAHAAICGRHSPSGHSRRMASTLTAMHVGPEVLTVVQVGDSRAYRFGNGKLTLLTEDQTFVHMMQKRGMLTDEEARHHPQRHTILQAVGQDMALVPEVQTFPIQDGDCLLLCTDGLSSYVPHDRIEAILASEGDENVRCCRLVEAANAAGGADNVTVLLARLMVQEVVPHEGGSQITSHAEKQAAEPARQSAWTVALKLPRSNKATRHQEGQVGKKARPHFWKRGIKWLWSNKTTGRVVGAADAQAQESIRPQDLPLPAERNRP